MMSSVWFEIQRKGQKESSNVPFRVERRRKHKSVKGDIDVRISGPYHFYTFGDSQKSPVFGFSRFVQSVYVDAVLRTSDCH